MNHRLVIGRTSKNESPQVNRPLVRAGVGMIASLSAAGLALALSVASGCIPEPVPEPPCTFHSEVEVAHGELIREPGNPWHDATFTSEAGLHVIEFHLDGMPAAEAIVDGQKLNLSAGVSVKDEVVLRFELNLSAGLHELSLRVAGPPGGRLSYTLGRVVASDEPAITDSFTVHQGQASVHALCGGTSSIAFAGSALQPGDQELNVTVHCEAAACVEGGESLASPRLVFDTPNNGYQFRTPPVLDHPTTSKSVRELDGVPIASEEVGSMVIDGVPARLLRSRISHFSTVEDRDLAPWCTQQLEQLNASASHVCYSSGDEPGMQYLVLCESGGGAASASEASACGIGPDACLVVDNMDDSCNPEAVDCAERARGALEIDPCPPLADDSSGSASHSLRCNEFTNQVFVGMPDAETGECELRGDSLLTRDQQVKTVLAATFGPHFMEGIAEYLATNDDCAMRDFASEFVDYSTWEDTWSTDILKFAICVDVLHGRGLPGNLEIAPKARVQQAEMAAMMVRAGGVAPLVLPDSTQLDPHPRFVELNQHQATLLDDLAQPVVNLVNQDCPDAAWFFTDQVLQAVIDEGVVCDVDALAWMTRKRTAQWLYNLVTEPVTCAEAEVSCEGAYYPDEQPCETCSSIESCQDLLDQIISVFPDYAARDTKITFGVWNASYCQRQGDTINCPTTWVTNGTVTNKLLFHELNHALREDRIDSVGDIGICSDGGCNSGEFQASLLEGYYFPGPESECMGGHYQFTDSNDVARTVADLGDALQQSPAVPEEALWGYAMGREDTLIPYLERFDVSTTEDLYHSQTYSW